MRSKTASRVRIPASPPKCSPPFLSEAIARAGIKRIGEVPVVDALSVTLKAAEMMHDLCMLGITMSRHGVSNALPSAGMIEHARRMHRRGEDSGG